MKTIALTSPYTRGEHVVRMQAALKRGNIFKADYLKGPQDGIAGEGTIRAFPRAKYWLGYGAGSLQPYGGDQLYAYLTGAKPLGPVMRLRRARRLRAANETPLRVKALNLARTKIDTKEWPAGSNRVEFSEWYGLIGPWCAMFVTWAYVKAGSKSFKPGLTGVGGLHPGSGTYAYVPYIVADARAGRNNLQVISAEDVQPGDIPCFNWDGDWDADHVGIFERWVGGGFFESIEGNTGIGNDSNGGQVMRRSRRVSQVQAFVRVGA